MLLVVLLSMLMMIEAHLRFGAGPQRRCDGSQGVDIPTASLRMPVCFDTVNWRALFLSYLIALPPDAYPHYEAFSVQSIKICQYQATRSWWINRRVFFVSCYHHFVTLHYVTHRRHCAAFQLNVKKKLETCRWHLALDFRIFSLHTFSDWFWCQTSVRVKRG